MNTRTLIAGDAYSPVILHVPHASRVIPSEICSSLASPAINSPPNSTRSPTRIPT